MKSVVISIAAKVAIRAVAVQDFIYLFFRLLLFAFPFDGVYLKALHL